MRGPCGDGAGAVTWLAVALGAALGAPCRYLLDRAVGRPPWGTLLVNLLGSLAAGVLAGLALEAGPVVSLLGVGFLGAFTTASTLAADVLSLNADGRRREAVLDLVLSVGPGLVLAGAGLVLGRSL